MSSTDMISEGNRQPRLGLGAVGARNGDCTIRRRGGVRCGVDRIRPRCVCARRNGVRAYSSPRTRMSSLFGATRLLPLRPEDRHGLFPYAWEEFQQDSVVVRSSSLAWPCRVFGFCGHARRFWVYINKPMIRLNVYFYNKSNPCQSVKSYGIITTKELSLKGHLFLW